MTEWTNLFFRITEIMNFDFCFLNRAIVWDGDADGQAASQTVTSWRCPDHSSVFVCVFKFRMRVKQKKKKKQRKGKNKKEKKVLRDKVVIGIGLPFSFATIIFNSSSVAVHFRTN